MRRPLKTIAPLTDDSSKDEDANEVADDGEDVSVKSTERSRLKF